MSRGGTEPVADRGTSTGRLNNCPMIGVRPTEGADGELTELPDEEDGRADIGDGIDRGAELIGADPVLREIDGAKPGLRETDIGSVRRGIPEDEGLNDGA